MPAAPSDTSDFVVVGAGLAGAATAWQLAARGHQVTLLERSIPAAHDGSSHGSARIFRYAYPDPFYTRAVLESKALWDGLAAASGTSLITPFGAVDYGPERNPRLLASVLAGEGIEHELLSPADARKRWPQIAFDTEVLWHPGAGVIDAEGAVNAMISLAVGHGARLLTGWELQSVERTPAGYRLRSSSGETVDAGNVVISAGGWLPGLLGQLALPAGFLARLPQFTVRQEQAFHFKYRDHDGGAASGGTGPEATAWPTFIHKAADIQAYGLPGGRDAGFAGQKVAEYNGGKLIPSAVEQTGEVDPANRRRVVDYVRRYLPGLDPEPYAETTCLFTNTPNEDFVIDRAENLTVLSPCSGHGAKFAPLIGLWAADLATGTGAVPGRFRMASPTALTT
ncbi:FAD dependent oxidoreductase family protein [Pseudarthrobacter siccitolerans]|uniref:FAD dependent oxidoreductase family protein n=1 Tax=Pseudarthrobacter siccitolerans TaxID=861266 RepID=A0A024GWF5_9MICC|nr:FAD-dependent oxidoreductase [Pseudarthrobacter siccitolerans]CCQ44245.1 FAD dependent oxidoreductase family protein [Pseudarthrobacter siccitolerans]